MIPIPNPKDFTDWLREQGSGIVDQSPISYNGPMPSGLPFVDMPRSPQQAGQNARNNLGAIADLFGIPSPSNLMPSPQDLMPMAPGFLPMPFAKQGSKKKESGPANAAEYDAQATGQLPEGGLSPEDSEVLQQGEVKFENSARGSRSEEAAWIDTLDNETYNRGKKSVTSAVGVVLQNSGIPASEKVQSQFRKGAAGIIADFNKEFQGKPKPSQTAYYEVLSGYLQELNAIEAAQAAGGEAVSQLVDENGQIIKGNGWNPNDTTNPKNQKGLTERNSTVYDPSTVAAAGGQPGGDGQGVDFALQNFADFLLGSFGLGR